MSIILIRHASVTPDPQQPPSQWTLNAGGRYHSALLARHLRPYAVQRVFTSAERKAQQTGMIIASGLGISYEIVDDLDETRRTGDFITDQQAFKQQVRQAMRQPDQRIFGDEPFSAARDRFLNCLSMLMKVYPDNTLALVSHGRVLSMVLAQLSGRDPMAIWDDLKMPAYIVLDHPDLTGCEWVNEIPS